MKNVKITINGAASEKPMRNILGMNNLPRIFHFQLKEQDQKLFDALNLKHVRFHDAPIENPSQLIIDVSRIFPLFHQDETDSRNYFFLQTDDYVSQLEGKDINIDFRIGETIDHSKNARLIGAPADIDKWARVCRNIIAHYKNGEMNGMKLNITRVSVWEEPDNNRLFSGTPEEYAEMFCKLYKVLKKDFPDLEIGGPAMMIGQYEYLENFLTLCKNNGVTPDFINSTLYALTSDEMLDFLVKYHDISDKVCQKDIKHSVVEWHLAPTCWDGSLPNAYAAFTKTENAAFACETLMKFMDLDFVDIAYFYAWGVSSFTVVGRPVYYGLLLFQKLATECTERLAVNIDADQTIHCLAGMTPDKKLRLLISCLRGEDATISLDIKNAKACSMYAVHDDYNENDALETVSVSGNDGTFELVHNGKNGVYLLEFEF